MEKAYLNIFSKEAARIILQLFSKQKIEFLISAFYLVNEKILCEPNLVKTRISQLLGEEKIRYQ